MDWYYALCQHPMYLIIEEDDSAAERIPPWGEPTIEGYIARIRRNLAALERYPQLKLNYDFSGVELERLAARDPELIQALRRAYQAGRISFVNGNYAQAHLHAFGAESNLRQLQLGLAAIKAIVGQRVQTFAHQEPANHDQMPQLLRALGYRYAVAPSFFYVIMFLDPHEIQAVQYQGLRYLQGEEFTHWQGLDGSTIPLYLPQPRILPKGGIHGSESHARAVRTEYVKDTLRYPPLRCDYPDMVEIDDAWIADLADHTHVVLEEALDARMAAWPPHSRARVYTYWGSGEGLGAEELHRSNRAGEVALIRGASMDALAAALLDGWQTSDLSESWRRLLTAQHHDAYWVGAPVLREKAIGWARASAHEGNALSSRATAALADVVDTREQLGLPALVVEPWPIRRHDCVWGEWELPAQTQAVTACNAQGESLPAQILEREALRPGVDRCIVGCALHSQGLGYQTIWLQPVAGAESQKVGQTEHQQECQVATTHYCAVIAADGTLPSLQLSGDGRELIADGSAGGNSLRGQDENGKWQTFQPTGMLHVRRGSLATVIEVAGTFAAAPVRQRLICYTELPRIDVRLSFDFDQTRIGNFWIDASKLNVSWPVAPRGTIWHDIPFGAVAAREARPLFALTWIRVGDDEVGLACFNRGTVRHRVEGNVLANVLACGVETDDIGTRARPEPYARVFDLRLCGRQVIEYAVYPHRGDWRAAAVPLHALVYQYPLEVQSCQHTAGHLPPTRTLARLQQANIVPTAVWWQDQQLRLRMFETYGEAGSLDLVEGSPADLRALDGHALQEVPPFGIVEGTLFSHL